MLSNEKMASFDSLAFDNIESSIETYLNENPMLVTPEVNFDNFDWNLLKSSTPTGTAPSFGKMMSGQMNTINNMNGVNQTFVLTQQQQQQQSQADVSPYSYSSPMSNEYPDYLPIKHETTDVNFASPMRDMVSPSMMQPVSPNTIFQGSQETYSNDYGVGQTIITTLNGGQTLLSGDSNNSYLFGDYYEPKMNSLGSIDQMSSGSQPFSPKSISSNESMCGEEKTFANLDNATLCYQLQQQQQQQQSMPVQIKQELEDFPTVINECFNEYVPQQQQYDVLPSNTSNVLTADPMFSQTTYLSSTSNNTTTTSNITQQSTASTNFAQFQQPQLYSIPSTVQGAVQQQQMTAASITTTTTPTSMLTLATPSATSTATTSSGNSRRRAGAVSAGNHTTPKQIGGGVTKKARMSKREKQLMMENQITNYLKEKEDLTATISLLTRKIEFCKKYLSENVKPFIQHQQQQQLFQQVSL